MRGMQHWRLRAAAPRGAGCRPSKSLQQEHTTCRRVSHSKGVPTIMLLGCSALRRLRRRHITSLSLAPNFCHRLGSAPALAHTLKTTLRTCTLNHSNHRKRELARELNHGGLRGISRGGLAGSLPAPPTARASLYAASEERAKAPDTGLPLPPLAAARVRRPPRLATEPTPTPSLQGHVKEIVWHVARTPDGNDAALFPAVHDYLPQDAPQRLFPHPQHSCDASTCAAALAGAAPVMISPLTALEAALLTALLGVLLAWLASLLLLRRRPKPADSSTAGGYPAAPLVLADLPRFPHAGPDWPAASNSSSTTAVMAFLRFSKLPYTKVEVCGLSRLSLCDLGSSKPTAARHPLLPTASHCSHRRASPTPPAPPTGTCRSWSAAGSEPAPAAAPSCAT